MATILILKLVTEPPTRSIRWVTNPSQQSRLVNTHNASGQGVDCLRPCLQADGYFYLFLTKLEANQHWLWSADLRLAFAPRQVWWLK